MEARRGILRSRLVEADPHRATSNQATHRTSAIQPDACEVCHPGAEPQCRSRDVLDGSVESDRRGSDSHRRLHRKDGHAVQLLQQHDSQQWSDDATCTQRLNRARAVSEEDEHHVAADEVERLVSHIFYLFTVPHNNNNAQIDIIIVLKVCTHKYYYFN